MIRRVIFTAMTSVVVVGCSVQPGADVVLQGLAARAPTGGGPIPVQPGSDSDRSTLGNAAQEIGGSVPSVPQPATESGPVDSMTNITVTAPYTFAGTWKITTPTNISVRGVGPATYNNVRQTVCRFEQSDERLKGACVPFRKRMRGSLKGDKVSLDWTRGIVSAHIDGTMLSETGFNGTMSVGMIGANLPTDIPAYGVKLLRGETSRAEIDDLAAKVLADLAADSFPPDRYSAAGLDKLRATSPSPPADRIALGPQTSLSFVTQAIIPATEDEAEKIMNVYDVEYAHGWRLCGFIIDKEDKVADIDCR